MEEKKMVLTDIINIGAGAYKGWLNAGGQPVDYTHLMYILGSTSLLSGLGESLRVNILKNSSGLEYIHTYHGECLLKGEEITPAKEGIKKGLRKIPLGMIEMAAGFMMGYYSHMALKLFS